MIGLEDSVYVLSVYVSVLLVRGRVGEAPASGPDLAKPQVRFGNIGLTVNNEKPLKVEVRTSGNKFKPGDEVSAVVTVQQSLNKIYANTANAPRLARLILSALLTALLRQH